MDIGHTEMVCTNQNSGYGFKSGDDTMSTVTANGVSYCGDFTLDGMRMGTPNPYSSGNSIGRNGENEFYDLMCIGGVMSTVTYHSFEHSYGVENQWSIGGCSGRNANGGVDYPEGVEPDYAGTTATFPAECCIPYSGAELTCVDTYDDTWSGDGNGDSNYLTIAAFPNQRFCEGTFPDDNEDETCTPFSADDSDKESRCARTEVLPIEGEAATYMVVIHCSLSHHWALKPFSRPLLVADAHVRSATATASGIRLRCLHLQREHVQQRRKHHRQRCRHVLHGLRDRLHCGPGDEWGVRRLGGQ
jgi:hypothetical protein